MAQRPQRGDRRHGGRLASLIGRRLTDGWLVWDHRYAAWLADCPVVLNFGGEQIEICHQEFDQLSITWNIIIPTARIEWSDADDTTGSARLEWRNDADPRLAAFNGRRLVSIDLLEWDGRAGDFGNGTLAVSFGFGPERVTIANGLDENILEFGRPHSCYRSHPIASARR